MDRTGWFGFFIVTAVGMMLGQARADMVPIFSDSFTAANGTQLVGRMPDPVDVLGVAYKGIYSIQSYTTSPYPFTNVQSSQGRVGADVGLGLPIASYLSANPVTVLYVSAVLDPDGLTYNSDSETGHTVGLGLGFWVQGQPVKSDGVSGDNGNHAPDGFSGLRLGQNASGGFLSLFVDGALIQADSYSGTWNQTAPHTLSYGVSLVTGNIENVVLDGVAYSFPTITAFNNPLNLGYVGFDGSGTLISQTGFIDDFVVAVPEPASLGLLTILSVPILRRRR